MVFGHSALDAEGMSRGLSAVCVICVPVAFHVHLLPRDGMDEAQRAGVQVEAVGRRAVERVAHDGAAEAFGMGGVDAELVRAPRQRTEADERAALAAFQHFVEGLRRFGVGRPHLLAGAVVRAGSQGQVDEAAVRRDGALEQGDVFLLHGARLEEGLQAAVHVGGLGDEHQAGSVHVQAVHHERAFGLGQAAAHQAEHRGGVGLPARHGEQAGGLVDDEQPRVLIDRAQAVGRSVGHLLLQRVVVHVEALEHVLQDGAALARTGGVETAVLAYLVRRRAAPPELGHAEGLPLVEIGLLEQLGRGTLACTGGRGTLAGGGEDGAEVFGLAAGVEHLEVPEEAHLQGGGAAVAFGLQFADGGEQAVEGGLRFGFAGLPGAFGALVFGLLVLALARQGGFLVGRQGGRLAQAVACIAGLLHQTPHFGQVFVGLALDFLHLFLQQTHVLVGLQRGDAAVQGGNLFFLLLEEAVGPEQVVDGRHEEGQAVLPRQDAREGGQVAQLPLAGAHHQHAEHLAALQLVVPLRLRRQVLLHLVRGQQAERVGRVGKGIGEPPGRLDALGGRGERVEHLRPVAGGACGGFLQPRRVFLLLFPCRLAGLVGVALAFQIVVGHRMDN